jgi:hypothetical protein
MNTRGWKQCLFAAPGLGAALLPKVICPFCWPAYAGLLSTLGLGFLISTSYLLPLTALLLTAAVGSLAFRASRHRGLRPFWLGLAGMFLVLIGKFYLTWPRITYGGVGLLALASLWNVWPHRARTAHCVTCVQAEGASMMEYKKGEVRL